MPEVVYPSPDAEGNSRTWDVVFPIWKNDNDNSEWRTINTILEAIAMNNRFGGKTVEELRGHLNNEIMVNCHKFLEEVGTENLEEREKLFRQLGQYLYYVAQVFQNLGGAYREHKS